MTKTEFITALKHSTAHRQSRENIRNLVLADVHLLANLFDYGCKPAQKDYHKAWWTMELIFEHQIDLILPYLDRFCLIANQITSDSALRSFTKICLFISKSNFLLKETQKEAIYSCLFDCLISTDKAANAAYSMYALYEFGSENHWIREELQLILSKEFTTQTPAYRAATKSVLKKMNLKS